MSNFEFGKWLFYGFEVLNSGLTESYNYLGHNLWPVGSWFGGSKVNFKIWWEISNCLTFWFWFYISLIILSCLTYFLITFDAKVFTAWQRLLYLSWMCFLDMMVHISLMQIVFDGSDDRLLAWYNCSARQFLYPIPHYFSRFGIHDREVLMERSVIFPVS